MHPMVHYNDTFFPAARTSPNAQNPGTQAGQPPRPCSGMETARALRGHDTEIRGDGRRTKKNGASSHHHYVRNVPLRCTIAMLHYIAMVHCNTPDDERTRGVHAKLRTWAAEHHRGAAVGRRRDTVTFHGRPSSDTRETCIPGTPTPPIYHCNAPLSSTFLTPTPRCTIAMYHSTAHRRESSGSTAYSSASKTQGDKTKTILLPLGATTNGRPTAGSRTSRSTSGNLPRSYP